MTRERVALVVYVDLDPIPGAFHTKESALNNLRGILEDVINHYNPTVAHAPDSLQPTSAGVLPDYNMHVESIMNDWPIAKEESKEA